MWHLQLGLLYWQLRAYLVCSPEHHFDVSAFYLYTNLICWTFLSFGPLFRVTFDFCGLSNIELSWFVNIEYDFEMTVLPESNDLYFPKVPLKTLMTQGSPIYTNWIYRATVLDQSHVWFQVKDFGSTVWSSLTWLSDISITSTCLRLGLSDKWLHFFY